MDSKELDRENAINTALASIKAGRPKIDVLSTLSKLCPKMSSKTLKRYYDTAMSRCENYHNSINQIIESKEIEIIGNTSIGIGIISKLKRQQILSEIALGQVTHLKQVPTKFGVETVEVWPTWSDRKAAIQELNRMDGAYVSEIETTIKPIQFTIIKNKE